MIRPRITLRMKLWVTSKRGRDFVRFRFATARQGFYSRGLPVCLGKCLYFGCVCVSDGKNAANCANVNPVASRTHDKLLVLSHLGWPCRVLYLLGLKVVGFSPEMRANREQDI